LIKLWLHLQPGEALGKLDVQDATTQRGLSGTALLETNPLSCSNPSPNPPARVTVTRPLQLSKHRSALFAFWLTLTPACFFPFHDPHRPMVTWDDDCQSEIARGRSSNHLAEGGRAANMFAAPLCFLPLRP